MTVEITPALLNDLAQSIEAGIGVRQRIAQLGLPVEPTMIELRDRHITVIANAKKKFHKKHKEKTKNK